MSRNYRRWLAAAALSFATLAEAGASTTLVVGDFISPGDHLIVTDTSTGIKWLKPIYTSGQEYDDAFVQNLMTTYGFVYATETQVTSMINNNFNNPPVGYPGTTAGYTDVANFFSYFGVNEYVSCSNGSSYSSCPRTQGLTSTSSGPGDHVGVGMIQLYGNGYMIDPNPWSDAQGGDPQMGSWLIITVPEPNSFAYCALGLALAVLRIRRLRPTLLPKPFDLERSPH